MHGARHAHSELDLVGVRIRFRFRVGSRVSVRVIYQRARLTQTELRSSCQPGTWSVAPTQTAPEGWTVAGKAVRLAKASEARSVLVLTWSATPASEMLMSVIELFDGK